MNFSEPWWLKTIPFEKNILVTVWSFPPRFSGWKMKDILKPPPSFIHGFFLLTWGFQTPNVRRYDRTPKNHKPNFQLVVFVEFWGEEIDPAVFWAAIFYGSTGPPISKNHTTPFVFLGPAFRIFNIFNLLSNSSWWFQPIWKILVNLDHFPS